MPKGQGFAFSTCTRTVFGNNRSTEAAITQGRDLDLRPGSRRVEPRRRGAARSTRRGLLLTASRLALNAHRQPSADLVAALAAAAGPPPPWRTTTAPLELPPPPPTRSAARRLPPAALPPVDDPAAAVVMEAEEPPAASSLVARPELLQK